MKRILAVAAALVLLGLGVAAHADVFNLGAGLTNLETVAVGDRDNAADNTGYGSVGYNYNIGKYEVTAGQYTDFLDAKAKTDDYGLYNTNMDWHFSTFGCGIQRAGTWGSYTYSVANNRMGGFWANRPVNYVSYWDACRFANWLSNGQGDGDTETGAYTLNGYNGSDGRTIGRNAGAKWAVTSEDEWYKAAYYKGGNTTAGYWLYPTSSNAAPGRDAADSSGNNANYYTNDYLIGFPYFRTDVGEFQHSDSAYGTLDQGGNVWEWNEPVISSASRGLRGGSFIDNGILLQSSSRYSLYPISEHYDVGFRVSEVPEPSSLIALAGGMMSLLGMRRRRA